MTKLTSGIRKNKSFYYRYLAQLFIAINLSCTDHKSKVELPDECPPLLTLWEFYRNFSL